MPKSKTVPIQQTNPDGSVSVTSKQLTIIDILNNLDEKRNSSNKFDVLGFYNDIQVNLYEIDDEKWILLSELRMALGESQQASWDRYNRLINEWNSIANRFFLKDHKTISRSRFYEYFPSQEDLVRSKMPGKLILLSPDDAILYVSRSSKERNRAVLIWLVETLEKKRIEVKEAKSIHQLAQLLESSAEREYFKEAILYLDLQKLKPQKYIGKYRGDFVIDDAFLVMIKGFFYHSHKDKMLADARRERYIQKEKYFCITFWAEEIILDPHGCVMETIEIINKNKHLLERPGEEITKKSNKKSTKKQK